MEVLGVASGTAGCISLGITVCQSLLDYYHSWKDAGDSIVKTYVSIEELSKTLRLIAIAVGYREFNGDIVDQVRGSIERAKGSINNLEKKLDKIRVVPLQNDWKGKAKAQFQRTLYPFKESTLAKLRELSSETRDNLSLALHLLQIDASATSLRKLNLLGQQAAEVSANVDSLTQQSTSILTNVRDIAGYTREIASMESSKELREWLSGHLDPTLKQDETWRERHPDTGQWFLQSREFRTWLEEPVQQTPRVFNIVGKSGAGKTSLISSAIKAAQSMERDRSQIAVAYYYCSFSEAASQDPVQMVGSFISQISAVCPAVLEGLEVRFARRERPNLRDLEQRLTSQTSHSSLKTLVLVDAVNECKNVEPMIETLLRLAESTSDIRVLFTSTDEDPIITALTGIKPPKVMILRMSAMNADISLFIEAKMKEKRNLQKLPLEKREEIKHVLSKRAGGMFRWVQCQIEHLGNQSTGRLIQKALDELPADLNSTYASILARIPEANQELAREAMIWLCFAFRPLRLTELCETLAFNNSAQTLDQSDRLLDNHDLLRWCQGLVSYHPRKSDVTLSHSSVRTYLLSDQIKHSPSFFFSIDETAAERLLLRKCLTYMMFTDFSKGCYPTFHEWKAVSRQWPLLGYASIHWPAHSHVLDAELEPDDQDLIQKLYSTSNQERGGNFGFWVQCLYSEADHRVARDTQPLYYAASFGLRAVVHSLISTKTDIDLDALGGRNDSTALQVACFRGHYGVAQDLLDAGANPYFRDQYGRSSLFYALCYGDDDIAELLRQSLRSRTDPKGEAASDHIQEAIATARMFIGRKRQNFLTA